MTDRYRAITWSPFKRLYDGVVALGIVLYIAVFITTSILLQPDGETFHPTQLAMRATGSLAFLMLTFVLAIGPLARLWPRAKPLLFNRRHVGVMTFLVGLVHASLALVWYAGSGVVDPLTAFFTSNPRYDAIAGFPFEVLGLGALVILFLMAATSHDFWLEILGARFWKSVHMAVYVAFGLLVAHVALGAIQFEKAPLYPLLLAAAALTLASLHLVTGFREWRTDRRPTERREGLVRVAPFDDIPLDRAVIVALPAGERVAVFRHAGGASALTNVCRHQGGPLGEGRIIEGCVTCPWHGWQYRPEDGRAPPPHTERVSTFRLHIIDGVVFVEPKALPPGTAVEPVRPFRKAS